MEENNRMGKTRDLFKKIRDTKGTFHENMGTIKDRNDKNLTEAEDIKKRWQEYMKQLYKRDLDDPDNHGSVVAHLEPDILNCEVKWVLGSITTNKISGDDGIPAELFQILKNNAMKEPANWLKMPANWENSAVATGLKKIIFIPISKNGNAKEYSKYHTIALISHTSKVMLKIL